MTPGRARSSTRSARWPDAQVVVYRLYAQQLGIPFDEIAIRAEADLDAARLFGADESVRAGFSEVRLDIELSGTETDERYDELREAVECPLPGARHLPEPDPGHNHRHPRLIRRICRRAAVFAVQIDLERGAVASHVRQPNRPGELRAQVREVTTAAPVSRRAMTAAIIG